MPVGRSERTKSTAADSPGASRAIDPPADKKLLRDLKTLTRFIAIYCRYRHAATDKLSVQLKTHDVTTLARGQLTLCADCTRLLAHALVKRSHCPLDPKPACKHCPRHCYHPKYRAAIREVMRYSGRKLVLSGRLDYFIHLLF